MSESTDRLEDERLADLILLAEKGMGWQRYDRGTHNWPSRGLYAVVADNILLPFGSSDNKIWNPFTHPADAMDLQSRLVISLTAIGHPVKRWQAGSNEDEPGSLYVEAIVEEGGTEAICQAISECALKIVMAREGSMPKAIEKS